MSINSGQVTPCETFWRFDAYATSVANPPRYPRFVVLKGSCGHRLGVGVVWHRQRYVKFRSCGIRRT